MSRRHPATPPGRDGLILSICEAHLEREEALLSDVLASLRLVRAAFVRRRLDDLAALSDRQEQLARTSQELDRARDELRAALAPLLGLAPAEVTLRSAALSLEEPARGRLLHRHGRILAAAAEADRLNHHNAALLGHARSFLRRLFAGLTGGSVGDGYGRRGEPAAAVCGSFLQARG